LIIHTIDLPMNKYNYIICSGWWCGENDSSNNTRVLVGDDSIRGKEFHNLWYQSITNFTNPQKIFIVDSNSPILPELNKEDKRIEFVSLPLNAGHSTKHKGKYSGWLRSVLMGLEYAYLSDTDYFVYVEQDALLYGENIIEECISKMTKPYMFGNGKGTKQPLQQSFFIIRRDGMAKFLSRIQSIKANDSKFSPEMKFAYATTLFWRLFPDLFFNTRGTWRLVKLYVNCNFIPFGYGRSRPMNFSDSKFYFQHGSKEELNTYLSLINKTSNES